MDALDGGHAQSTTSMTERPAKAQIIHAYIQIHGGQKQNRRNLIKPSYSSACIPREYNESVDEWLASLPQSSEVGAVRVRVFFSLDALVSSHVAKM